MAAVLLAAGSLIASVPAWASGAAASPGSAMPSEPASPPAENATPDFRQGGQPASPSQLDLQTPEPALSSVRSPGVSPTASTDRLIAALPPALDAISANVITAGAANAFTTLTLLTAKPDGVDVSVTLTNITYDNGVQPAAGKPLSGKGDLNITLASMPPVTVPTCPFQNLVVDDQGRASGGGVGLSADLAEPNLFNTGVDVTLGKGSQVTVTKQNGQAALNIASSLKAALPFFSSTGDQAGLDCPNTTVEIDGNGGFQFQSQHNQLTGPTSDGVTLAGLNLRIADADLSLKKMPGSSVQFSVTANNPVISMNVPNLLCQDDMPLQLTATKATIDQTGIPSFQDAQLAVQKDANGNPQTPVLRLAQPLDFALTLHSVDATYTNGQFQKLDIKADMVLPEYFKADNGDRVTIQNLDLDATHGMSTSFNLPNAIGVNWDGFGLHASGTVVVDLSTAAAPSGIPSDTPGDEKTLMTDPKWEGVFFQKVSVNLPASLSSNNQPTTIQGTDFLVDSHGISGSISAGPGAVPNIAFDGFAATINSATLTFVRSTLTAGEVDGTVAISAWDNQTIGVKGSLASSGLVTISLDLSKPLTVSSFGMQVSFSGGSFQTGGDQKTRLQLTGSFSFPGIEQLKDAAVQFTNLQINPDGTINLPGAWLTLPQPITLPLPLLTLECSQIGFGMDPQDRWIGFTGGVKVSEDLPEIPSVNFDGLKIHATANGPHITIGGIDLTTNIPNVVSIEAGLSEQTVNGVDCLAGSAKLTLDLAGPTQGMGGSLMFVVAQGAWFVEGSADLPAGAGIPLGDSGLALYAFLGGLGHNVKVADGVTGPPTQTSDIDITPGSGSWLFVAGVTIGTVDAFTFWGPVTLTVQTTPFMIDLNGQAYFLQPVNVPTNDRHAWADINWNSQADSFRAQLGATFILPGDGLNLAEADGSAEILLSPSDKHIWVGWPINPNALQVKIAGGLITVSGGVYYDISQGTFGGSFSAHNIPVYVGTTVGIDASLNGGFRPLNLQGSVHLTGEVNFLDVLTAQVDVWINGSMTTQTQPPAATMDVNGEVKGTITIPGGDLWAQTGMDVQFSTPPPTTNFTFNGFQSGADWSPSQAVSDVVNDVGNAVSDVGNDIGNAIGSIF